MFMQLSTPVAFILVNQLLLQHSQKRGHLKRSQEMTTNQIYPNSRTNLHAQHNWWTNYLMKLPGKLSTSIKSITHKTKIMTPQHKISKMTDIFYSNH